MVDNRMMIQKLVAELGIDRMMALMKASAAIAVPITQEQLSRAADAVMNRHQSHREEEPHG
jgi:hypothetical protein